MPGNSQRRGAIRGSKKGPSGGSGGQRRKGLEARGATPKAVERTKHPAHKNAARTANRPLASGAAGPRKSAGAGSARGTGGPSRKTKGSSEIVYGRNSVVEALRAEIPVTTMYVAGRLESDDRVRESLKLATTRGIPILETPRGELDRITDGGVHQGLALQVPAYAYAHPTDFVNPEKRGIPLVVALDGITDPRNLGAIIRSVAAFGGHGVVVPERRSVGMTASAWKTSAGAAARIPVAQCSNLTRALEEFRRSGFFVLGLDMEGDITLPEIGLAKEPLVIVVGSEGKGLSRLVRETCDQIVSIPMSSAVESLNAGIATGVTLYEVARRRAL
jgi:23S rRNA (guanosine2251-2'-O)-methyltransferase